MSTQKKKKTSTGKIVLFVVEIVALIALLLVMWFVLKTTDSEKGVKRLELNESEIEVEFNESVKENEVMKGYKNIALFGVDSRNGDLANKTRTDTIIVASINEQTKEVKLVSVYRDTYLNQMGEKQNYGKCNAAYAYGGAEQAIKMLNANLDLDITEFVTIGFEGLRDVVDALGGVYIDVDAEEIKHLNNYQIAMGESMSDVSTYTPVTETGYQVLNGLQATAYCRIRYTAGNDFKRTERQREVIKACLETAKTVNPAALATMSQNVYSEVFTSFKLDDIISLLKDIASYSIVDEGGFPTEGMITTGTIGSAGSCVIPLDLEANVSWLHGFLFNETDYKPSSNVSDFSARVASDVSPYISGTPTSTGTATADDSEDDEDDWMN